MSGPKTINIRIYNGSLCEIVSTQADIRNLVDIIECFEISDMARNFHFSGADLLKELQSEIKKSYESVDMPRQTELEYHQSRDLGATIRAKKETLSNLKERLEELKEQCESAQRDYLLSIEAQGELESYFQKRRAAFADLYASLELHLESQSSDNIAADFRLHLQAIPPFPETPDFSLDLHKQKTKIIAQTESRYQKQEEELYRLHEAYCQKLNLKQIKQRTASKKTQETQEIENLLLLLPESRSRASICQEYEYLKQSPEYRTESSYKYLKNKLQGLIASIQRRSELMIIEKQLLSLPQSEDAAAYRQLLQKTMKQELISESAFAKLTHAWEALQEAHHKVQKEAYYQEQERRYIQDRLVSALETMNYKVVTDTHNLLGHPQSLTFKVPNQNNYIHLEELKGKYLYNFLVPEKRSELSGEDLRRKVLQMNSACAGFLKAMQSLKELGIDFDIAAKEASQQHIISIPARIRESLNLELEASELVARQEHIQKRMSND